MRSSTSTDGYTLPKLPPERPTTPPPTEIPVRTKEGRVARSVNGKFHTPAPLAAHSIETLTADPARTTEAVRSALKTADKALRNVILAAENNKPKDVALACQELQDTLNALAREHRSALDAAELLGTRLCRQIPDMNLLRLKSLNKALDALLNDPKKQHAKDSVLTDIAFAVKAELLMRQSDAIGWAKAATRVAKKMPMPPSRVAHLRQLSDLRKSVKELTALMQNRKSLEDHTPRLTGAKHGHVKGALPGTRLTRKHLERIEKLSTNAADQLTKHALKLAAAAPAEMPKTVSQVSMDELKQTYEALVWLKQEWGGFETGRHLKSLHDKIGTFIESTDLAIVDQLVGKARPITVTSLDDSALIELRRKAAMQGYKPDTLKEIIVAVDMQISARKSELERSYLAALKLSISSAAEEADTDGMLHSLLRAAMRTHEAVTVLDTLGKSVSDADLTQDLRTALRGSPFTKTLKSAQNLHGCLNSGDGKAMRALLPHAASHPQAVFGARFLNLLSTALDAWRPVDQAASQEATNDATPLTRAGVAGLRTNLHLAVHQNEQTPGKMFTDLVPSINRNKRILAEAKAAQNATVAVPVHTPMKVIEAISFLLSVTDDAAGLRELQSVNAPMINSTDASVKFRAKKLSEELEPALFQAETPDTVAKMPFDELRKFDAQLKGVAPATPNPKQIRLRTAVNARFYALADIFDIRVLGRTLSSFNASTATHLELVQLKKLIDAQPAHPSHIGEAIKVEIGVRIGRAKTEFQAALRAAIAETKASELPGRLLHSSNQAHAAASAFATLGIPFGDAELALWIGEVVQSATPSEATALQRDLAYGQGSLILRGLANHGQLRQNNDRAQFAFKYLETLAASVNTRLGAPIPTTGPRPAPPKLAPIQRALRRYLQVGIQKVGNTFKFFDLKPAISDAKVAVNKARGLDLTAIDASEKKALEGHLALLLGATIDIQELQGLQTVVDGLHDDDTEEDELPQMAKHALAYAEFHHPIS